MKMIDVSSYEEFWEADFGQKNNPDLIPAVDAARSFIEQLGGFDGQAMLVLIDGSQKEDDKFIEVMVATLPVQEEGDE